jgi:Protein of unknown function (DUF1236)
MRSPKEKVMSNSFLATIAAAGLVAGTIAASGQGMQGGGSSGGGSGAPAEKMDRGGSGGSGAGQGQGQQGQSIPSQQQERGTTGQSPRQGPEGQKASPQRQGQEGQKASPHRQDEQGRGTTGQSPRQGQDTQRQGQQPRQDMQRGEGRQPGATQDQGGPGGSTAQLTTEQRTQVRQTVLKSGNVPRLSRSDVDINISVGTVVPRTVRLVTVPQKIVEIRPAWRGFRYFVVDDEIVIVEPSSLKIVAVIPA